MKSINLIFSRLRVILNPVNKKKNYSKLSYSIFLRTFNYYYRLNKNIPKRILVYDTENSISIGLLWLMLGVKSITIIQKSKTLDFLVLKQNFSLISRFLIDKEFDDFKMIHDKLNIDTYHNLFSLLSNKSYLLKNQKLINDNIDLLISKKKSNLLVLKTNIDYCKNNKFDFFISINYVFKDISKNIVKISSALENQGLFYFIIFSNNAIKISNFDKNKFEFYFNKNFNLINYSLYPNEAKINNTSKILEQTFLYKKNNI